MEGQGTEVKSIVIQGSLGVWGAGPVGLSGKDLVSQKSNIKDMLVE